jgi:hypothetical protein
MKYLSCKDRIQAYVVVHSGTISYSTFASVIVRVGFRTFSHLQICLQQIHYLSTFGKLRKLHWLYRTLKLCYLVAVEIDST